MADRTCSIDDCHRKVRARGWCQTHYERWRRKGVVGGPVQRWERAVGCSVPGCERDHVSLGLCYLHLPRYQRNGDPGPVEPVRPREHPVGTRKVNIEGYVNLRVDTEDPLVKPMLKKTQRNWLLEHRVVMARKLGRPLSRQETVHHINGIRDDNRPENLELWHGAHGSGVRDRDPHCPTCSCEMRPL